LCDEGGGDASFMESGERKRRTMRGGGRDRRVQRKPDATAKKTNIRRIGARKQQP
jgi:hypothetical protein